MDKFDQLKEHIENLDQYDQDQLSLKRPVIYLALVAKRDGKNILIDQSQFYLIDPKQAEFYVFEYKNKEIDFDYTPPELLIVRGQNKKILDLSKDIKIKLTLPLLYLDNHQNNILIEKNSKANYIIMATRRLKSTSMLDILIDIITCKEIDPPDIFYCLYINHLLYKKEDWFFHPHARQKKKGNQLIEIIEASKDHQRSSPTFPHIQLGIY